MQGALLGSFLLHGLLLYALARPGATPSGADAPVQALRVQLVQQPIPATTEPSPTAPMAQSESTTPESTAASVETPKSLQAASTQSQEEPRAMMLWQPQEPKVKKMPELVFPPDTVNITAVLEIEVQLDKDGTALDVKIVRESPKAMFTEWAWEMGMKGQYQPKITASGPVPSKLNIRIDITPGLPMEVR